MKNLHRLIEEGVMEELKAELGGLKPEGFDESFKLVLGFMHKLSVWATEELQSLCSVVVSRGLAKGRKIYVDRASCRNRHCLQCLGCYRLHFPYFREVVKNGESIKRRNCRVDEFLGEGELRHFNALKNLRDSVIQVANALTLLFEGLGVVRGEEVVK